MTKPDRCRDRFERLVLQALQRMDRRDPREAPHCLFTPDEVVALLRREHAAVKRMVAKEQYLHLEIDDYTHGYVVACDDILAKLTAREK
jgi:hypothetical protein